MKRKVVVAKAGIGPKIKKSKRKQSTPTTTSSLGIVVIFFVLVFLLILISLVFKGFTLLKKSSYDGSHRFTIALASSTHPTDHMIEIVSVEPEQQSGSVLTVSYATSLSGVENFLKIPIDGEIVYDDLPSITSPKDIATTLGTILLHYNRVKSNLTIVDVIRFYLSARSLQGTAITLQSLDFGTNDVVVDRTTSSLFADHALVADGQTITIINATDVAGLGNRLARFISNMGGNVIAVRSSNKTAQQSTISYSKGTDKDMPYTIKRLHAVLHMATGSLQGGEISDIVITIGEDQANTSVF